MRFWKCWFLHNWDKWIFKEDTKVGGEPCDIQERECSRCGYREWEYA